MTPFAHAPVLGIHRLAGADVGTYLDLTMRYARADDGSPRILDSMMQHDADCPCLKGAGFPACSCPEVQVTFRDLTDLARRRTA